MMYSSECLERWNNGEENKCYRDDNVRVVELSD